MFSIILLSLFIFEKNPNQGNLFSTKPNSVSYTALPIIDNTIQGTAEASDGRVEKLRQFFLRYGSPLQPYAQDIVDAADQYGIDYKILPAIAMQESNLCKKVILDSNNCWGWGIYGKHVTRFPDYPTAIQTVSKGLAKHYISQGLVTTQQIMQRYNPTSSASNTF